MLLFSLLQLHVFLQGNKTVDVYNFRLFTTTSHAFSAVYAILSLCNSHDLRAGSSRHIDARDALCTPNLEARTTTLITEKNY